MGDPTIRIMAAIMKHIAVEDGEVCVRQQGIDTLRSALAEVTAAERERCVRAVEMEPECPGDMPDELRLVPMEDALRAAVRATKKNILAAIRKG